MHEGGSTQVFFLDDVGEIEQILLEAGKEEDTKPPGIAPENGPPMRPQLPEERQQPLLRCVGDDGDDFIADQQRDDCHDSPKDGEARRRARNKGGFSPNTSDCLGVNKRPAVSPCSDYPNIPAAPMAARALAGGSLRSPGASLVGTVAKVAHRPRPWAIQKYLRPKGPLAW